MEDTEFRSLIASGNREPATSSENADRPDESMDDTPATFRSLRPGGRPDRRVGPDPAVAHPVPCAEDACADRRQDDLTSGQEAPVRTPEQHDPAAEHPSFSAKAAVVQDEGTTLDGRYQIKREIGRGAMGVVYEAEDLRLSRRVS